MNKFLIVLMSTFISISSMASEGYYPAYHSNETGPSVGELQDALDSLPKYGFYFHTKIRVDLEQISPHTEEVYYIKMDACLAEDLNQCVSFGKSSVFTAFDDNITVLNYKFGNIGALKAYNFVKLMETQKEVIFVFRLYKKGSFFFFDDLVSQATLNFGQLATNAPNELNLRNNEEIKTTVQLLN